MRQHYLASTIFKLDIISLLPTDLAYLIMGPIALLRIPRIFKLPSFWDFFDLLDSAFSNAYVVRFVIHLYYLTNAY
jgi:cyclic nucleotide gated channel beta 1